MDGTLLDLIRNSRAQDGATYTHVSLYGPNEKWNIKSNELYNFWKKYCLLVNEKDGRYCLAEKSQDYMPILSKCTLRFQIERNLFEAYGEDFILSVVYCYQQAMLNLLQISIKGHELVCCVLEPDVDYYEDNIIVCQFALQFPYCRTETLFQTRVFRQYVIQLLRHENVMAKLPHQPINDWETIIDPLVPQEPWLMYKSTDHPNHPPLLLSHIYGKVEREHIETVNGPELELTDVFLPENHKYIQQELFPASILSGDFDHDLWVPLFLSVDYWDKVTLPKTDTTYSNTPTSLRTSASTSSNCDESEIDIVNRLIPLLSRERVEKDHYWLDVGKSLYNLECDRGGETGLNLWIRFTERSDEHSDEECRTLYPTFSVDNPLTIKTIAWYARHDSPEAYNQWHKERCRMAMDKALTCSHSDVAKALYEIYWLDFVCSSAKNKRWYHFHNHRYNALDDGITLRKHISNDFLGRFEQFRTDISRQIQELKDERMKKSLEFKIKEITELIKKLKTVNFKACLMKEATEFFHDEHFDGYIDSNPNLIGLFNGVIEVCGNNAYFREGKPEDYISKSTNVYWNDSLTWKHPLVQRCLKYLRCVFTDSELLQYFLKLSASCLKGRNSDKLFPILTGEGDNSKSMIKKLFEATFGSYCISFPTTIFTTRRSNSSSPSPELAQAKSARIAFLQEPDADDPFRSGPLKELTGGDTFFARLLNENGGNVVAMFKLFLMCNKVPIIPNSDKAVKNRLRIVPFLSTWVSSAPASEEEQFKERKFPKDPFFEKQIPELGIAFMWILVQKFTDYMNEGLEEPTIIKRHTEEYWQENDIYNQFTSERIEPAIIPGADPKDPKAQRDQNAHLTFGEIYQEFRFWYHDSFPGMKVPDRTVVKHELSQRWGKPGREGWAGIRLATQMANINSQDQITAFI